MQVTAHDVLDVVQSAVMVVAVAVVVRMLMIVRMLVIVWMPVVVRVLVAVVVVAFLLRAVYGDRHVRAGDPAFHGRLRLKVHARDAEAVELVEKRMPVGQKLEQRRGQHVAGGAHAAVEI